MKRLNGMDAMLLYSETPNLHTHTLKVAVIHADDYRVRFGEPFTFDVFRRTIAARLHLLERVSPLEWWGLGPEPYGRGVSFPVLGWAIA